MGYYQDECLLTCNCMIKLSVIGMPSPKMQNTKRVNRSNNQTKTPNGVKTFTFYRLETVIDCLAWEILITDGVK